jgi:hypothetical protein
MEVYVLILRKKIIICIASIIFLGILLIFSPLKFVVGFVYYIYQGHFVDYHKVRDEIPAKIMSYQGVKRAEVLYDEDYFEFEIAMYLENGGQLLLGDVTNNLRGSFRIERVGDYDVSRGRVLDNKMLGFLLGTRIYSVKDIVMKYDKVHSLIKSWPNLSEFRESPDESFSQIKERNKGIIKTICYHGKTFALVAYNWGEP